MTDLPIIFSTPMVRALLDGRKTQTRRLATSPLRRVQVGDRLYVRESAWIAPPYWTDAPQNPRGQHYQETAYVADDRSGYTRDAAADYKIKQTPSIHMPRWASRLTLTVEDVRFQRLQEISEADAQAEGAVPSGLEGSDVPDHCRIAFRDLWDSLHTEPGERWEDNPEIVALTFSVERRNIDEVEPCVADAANPTIAPAATSSNPDCSSGAESLS